MIDLVIAGNEVNRCLFSYPRYRNLKNHHC